MALANQIPYLNIKCITGFHDTTASLIKLPPLKVGVHLIHEVDNMLFTDPT